MEYGKSGEWLNVEPKIKGEDGWEDPKVGLVKHNGSWVKFFDPMAAPIPVAPEPFVLDTTKTVFRVTVDYSGVSFAAFGEGVIEIDWGDGSELAEYEVSSGPFGLDAGGTNLYHYYDRMASYYVQLKVKSGTITGIRAYDSSLGIKEVLSWGSGNDIATISLIRQSKLKRVPSTILPTMTDLNNMFNGCIAFNQDLSGWDTSTVTNMSAMFDKCRAFNSPLNTWNTGNVTDMRRMFARCKIFNQDLSAWDTSKVTVMSEMFQSSGFNQNIDSWDVSKVTNMNGMFEGCTSYNQPLNNWNTISLTNTAVMFQDCLAFNQPLNNWNFSNVAIASGMFIACEAFNGDLNEWDTSNLVTLENMFSNCYSFNKPLDNWNTGKVTNMYATFAGCTVFNQNLSTWDTSKVLGGSHYRFDQDCPVWLYVNKPVFINS